MSAAKCDVSFQIGYESTSPITEATVAYLDPQGPTHDIKQLLAVSNIIKLSEIQDDIQTPGTYKLEAKLVANETVTRREFSLTVDGCSSSSSCYVPKIYEINVLKDGQIVMNYWVDNTSDLATLEYQIARDLDFTDIIYSKVGFSDTAYTQFEYIDMKNGNIPNDTQLYIRIRKYCSSPSGISDWSNIVDFQSGEWKEPIAPYFFSVGCVPNRFDNPIDLQESICRTGGMWTRKVRLDTFIPQIGSFIYLSDGITLAVPGKLDELDGNTPVGFNENGIGWIRFPDYDPNVIYDVSPETARIKGISKYFC
ncbi:hypothetical protein ACN9MN_05590 [Chryseobacterium sp. S-02]|uniref:hypothetical protein n=1 Tax=Chryseobacterium sp. S-02 TaxID=3404064 RepID=UPI003CF72833